jgi:hypothetical protein
MRYSGVHVTTDILLAIHLIGLMLGAGGGISSGIIMRRTASLAPEQAMTLRSLGPTLTRVAAVGLVLLWITGPVLVLQRGGFGAMPSMFWVKFIFIATLTLATIAIEVTYAQIKAGNVAAAARLPVLGPIAGLSSFLAVIFAVLAFH